jgi:hydroxypyruvate reductase
LKPENSLQDNDAHSFFSALGDSVITGPTLTNVNDFRAILVEAGGGRIGDRKPLSGTL